MERFRQVLIYFMYTEGVEASREMKMDLDPLLHESVEYSDVLSVRPQHFRVPSLCNLLLQKFSFFIFKLCLMIVHILKMCTSYFVHVS